MEPALIISVVVAIFGIVTFIAGGYVAMKARAGDVWRSVAEGQQVQLEAKEATIRSQADTIMRLEALPNITKLWEITVKIQEYLVHMDDRFNRSMQDNTLVLKEIAASIKSSSQTTANVTKSDG